VPALGAAARKDQDKEPTMAKGQKRSTKEARKPKAADKKSSGPKYMQSSDLAKAGKSAVSKIGDKK
jgi:hypothetical protein